LQSVENQGFGTYSKATPKQQNLENQALDEIFWSFGVILGKVSFLTTRPARWHDFCTPDPFLFYTLLFYSKNSKENRQILENQGFDALE